MAEQPIKHLNSFLRGEISAVETYRQAIGKVADVRARRQLEECQSSHQRRVDILRTRIVQMGGQPEKSSGAWGAFAKAAEGGATIFGQKAAIDVLEEGEDYGLKDYQTHMSELDVDSRVFVEQELLPAQQQTHRILSDLKHVMH